MVGSRFTSAAEQNYSAVEGELQGVVDGLHKTRYYTQGCDKLLVGVDHKPLLGLLQGKRLEDIDNMRLRRLVEKTYGWRFKVVHIPGRKHGAPDAMSRGVPATAVECVTSGSGSSYIKNIPSKSPKVTSTGSVAA